MNNEKITKVYLLISSENFVGKRANLNYTDAFINFKPMKGFKNRRDVREFCCSDDSASSNFENELKLIMPGRSSQRERVAIVKSRMYKRGSNSDCGVVIETAWNSPETTNMRKRRFTESRDVIRQ